MAFNPHKRIVRQRDGESKLEYLAATGWTGDSKDALRFNLYQQADRDRAQGLIRLHGGSLED